MGGGGGVFITGILLIFCSQARKADPLLSQVDRPINRGGGGYNWDFTIASFLIDTRTFFGSSK